MDRSFGTATWRPQSEGAQPRQVHLIPGELFDALRTASFEVHAGELGENVATVGLDLERLPLGTVLRQADSAALELTGLRTPCVLIDRFEAGLKTRLLGGSAGPRFKAALDRGMISPVGPNANSGRRPRWSADGGTPEATDRLSKGARDPKAASWANAQMRRVFSWIVPDLNQ